MEFTRVDRKYVTIPITVTLPSGATALPKGVDVAAIPRSTRPTAATVWTPATFADGVATVLVAGPDADPTGALVVAADADLWVKVTDSPEVDAARATRITII